MDINLAPCLGLLLVWKCLMKFHEAVTLFDFEGIPLIGNYDTGYVIGLTQEAEKLCRKALVRDVDGSEFARTDPLLLQHLVKGGFFSRGEAIKEIESAYFHVTQRCNLSCRGCYSDDEDRNRLKDISFDFVCKGMKRLSDFGVKQLIISGGEPFLRTDLTNIVQFAKTICKFDSVVILTNGTCIKNETIYQMKPFVDCISVSIDGYSENCIAYIRGKQRFNELVKAVKTIKAAGISAHIIPTIHAKNIGDIGKYIKLANDLGATINFSLLSCKPKAKMDDLILAENDQIKLSHEIFKDNKENQVSFVDGPVGLNLSVKQSCGAGTQTVSIAADGGVYPCHMLQWKELCFGNIFEKTLSEIVSTERYQLFCASKKESCMDDCKFGPLCGGGCRARALMETQDISAADPYCTMIKTFYFLFGKKIKNQVETQNY